MVRKCSVLGCRTGYRKQLTDQKFSEKITVYKFPRDEEKRRRWVASLPNQLNLRDVTDHMGVCALHWPKDVPMERTTGRYHVPSVPPSIFQNVPQSCIPSTPRTTKKAYSARRSNKKLTQEARTHDVDEMPEFKEHDTLKADTFHDCFSARLNTFGLLTSDLSTRYILLSHERNGPIYKYSVYFDVVRDSKNYVTLKFELYQHLKRIHHPFIKDINCWSELDEVIRFMTTEEECSDVEMVRQGQLRTRNSAKHRQGQLRTRNTAKHRPVFTEMCQNLDKKVQLPSLVCGEQSGTVTTNIKVEKPFPVLRSLLAEHRQTLPDSASGGESVPTVCGTSDTSQSLAPGQARGTYYCPQCSTVLPDRSKLRRHFINTHISGSSKKSHASTDILTEYNDKPVNKDGCHEGVADDRENEGHQKQTHSCEVSSQKLIQENNNMLTVDKLQSGNGNSNETLQERISANEINSEACVRNKCQTVCGQKTFCIRTVKKAYKCEFCDVRFSQPSQLKTHASKHTGVKPFHCDVCGVGFAFKCFMDVHMRKHTGEKPYVCEYCDVRFVNSRQLKLHTTSHTGEKPYKCDVCMLGFNYAVSLQAHKVKHTGLKPFHCEVCGVGFAVKSRVQIHMRKHTGEKPYACEDCGARFVNRRQLKVHRISHTGEKPYKCDICGAGFNQAFGLKLHRRKHTGEEPYKCGKGYKPYVCEICGLTFSSNSAVQHHKRKHTGEKPHQCDVCGVAFVVKTSLISHRRKHTGETPYSCDVCGLRFSEIKTLQNHQRKHTGEKPHLCDICGTKFAFKDSLRDHKRIHTGEKPFKCGLCYKHFSNHKKLYSHRKVHARENLHTSAGLA